MRAEQIIRQAVGDTLVNQMLTERSLVARNCCVQWEEKSWRLNITAMFHDGLRSVPDETVKFCPWCGKAR